VPACEDDNTTPVQSTDNNQPTQSVETSTILSDEIAVIEHQPDDISDQTTDNQSTADNEDLATEVTDCISIHAEAIPDVRQEQIIVDFFRQSMPGNTRQLSLFFLLTSEVPFVQMRHS
jgi:hypothetical protein